MNQSLFSLILAKPIHTFSTPVAVDRKGKFESGPTPERRLSGGGSVKKTSLMSLSFGAVVLILFSKSITAAPYPLEGKQIEWAQPDGTRLILRVFGDEFYARTATNDGYTVIFEPTDKTYYYAIRGADGESLVASKVAAGKLPPKTLPKSMEESPKVVAAIRAENIAKFAPNRSSDWAARKKAVQEARARDAAAKATSDDTAPLPVSPPKGRSPVAP